MIYDLLADNCIILTKTCCEHDSVNAVHGCYISTDIFCCTITEYFYGQRCFFITFICRFIQVTEIAGNSTGKTIYS